jgi:hypothetical protein
MGDSIIDLDKSAAVNVSPAEPLVLCLVGEDARGFLEVMPMPCSSLVADSSDMDAASD